MPGFGKRYPFGDAWELVSESLRVIDCAVPEVPNVVRDTPHLRVGAHFVGLLDGSGSWRETYNDRASGLPQSHTQHADVVAFVRTAADAIGLDQVHAPTGVEAGN